MHSSVRTLAVVTAAASLVLVGAVPAMSDASSDTSVSVGRTAEADRSLRQRIADAQAYASSRPGVVGIVVHDRATGKTWRNPQADTLMWACSTPKLAMAVDMLLRDRARTITLTDEDRVLMSKMLRASDNDATTTLWNKYGGADFMTRFPSYGLTHSTFTDQHPHTWGWILTTASDLDRLMNHVLDRLPANLRGYLVNELRSVESNQQWGVWGAGRQARPGNKNGWSDDDDDGGWVTNSVGFVGPLERFTLAIMNDTRVIEGGFEVGQETTTHVAATLFDGYFG